MQQLTAGITRRGFERIPHGDVQPGLGTPSARPPAERSRWHVVAPFARYDPATDYTVLTPTSTIHAKEMGTLTTACGLRSDSWFKFWAEDFPMPGAEACQECRQVARSVPGR